MNLDVILSPQELPSLASRDLSTTCCVVFDVLRATTTLVTALANGAGAVRPVDDIPEALVVRQADPSVLLAGEREGLRIGAALTGGVEFDLGNSPREFTRGRVAGRRIAATTTNGTRALRACGHARSVLAAAFVNLEATRHWLAANPHEAVLLVCSGTGARPAYEDLLGAGALVDELVRTAGARQPWDASLAVQRLFLEQARDLPAAVAGSANGRRLLAIPDLAPDVALCSARDTHPIVAGMGRDGWIRRVEPNAG